MFLFHINSQGIVSIDVKTGKHLSTRTLHMLCLCNTNTHPNSESKCTSRIQHASECQMPLLDDQSTYCLVEVTVNPSFPSFVLFHLDFLHFASVHNYLISNS